MTTKEYDNLRVLPERKRATTNGKRMVKAFDKSCRDRTIIEHPEWLQLYDTDMVTKLTVMYFYFTKYISAGFDKRGYKVFTACFNNNGNGMYTDNILEDDIDDVNDFRDKVKSLFLDMNNGDI